MDTLRPGRYRHFKGNEYEVLGTARHSETLEPMVVYRALYGRVVCGYVLLRCGTKPCSGMATAVRVSSISVNKKEDGYFRPLFCYASSRALTACKYCHSSQRMIAATIICTTTDIKGENTPIMVATMPPIRESQKHQRMRPSG